ncbi:hypothetical protein GGR56DRAFT_296886 [Xylariaceae sp. FL0804]|nr:hypothetical protein GGR56DRAFT_296886 [Xylariaceae sp. FL0804]
MGHHLNSTEQAAEQAELEAYFHGPSSKPPPGVVSNLNHPPNYNGAAVALAVVCMVLATTAGLVRVYTRVAINKNVHLDDGKSSQKRHRQLQLLRLVTQFNVFSFRLVCFRMCHVDEGDSPFLYPSTVYIDQALYYGFAGIYFAFLYQVGFLVHQWDLFGYVLGDEARLVFVLDLFYLAWVGVAKSAVLLEWARIFMPVHSRNALFWIDRALLWANAGFNLAIWISIFFSCRPFSKIIHPWVGGTCVRRLARDVVSASFNLVIDFLIFALPQGIIWNLKLTRERKIGISLVFSIGLLACACAAGRIQVMTHLTYPNNLNVTFDSSYGLAKALLWVMAEETCVLLVFCAPAVPQAWGNLRLRPSAATKTKKSSSSSTRGTGSQSKNSWALRTIGSAPSKTPAYRRMDEEALTTRDDRFDTRTYSSSGGGMESMGQHGHQADYRLQETNISLSTEQFYI